MTEERTFTVTFINGAKQQSFNVRAYSPLGAVDMVREREGIPLELAPRATIEAPGMATLTQHADGSLTVE